MSPTMLDAVDWRGIIANVSPRSCFEYSLEFLRAVAPDSTPESKKALATFAILTGLRLDAENPVQPFSMEGWPSLDHLSEDDVRFLGELWKSVDDPELRARVADVVWLRLRRHEAAEAAVEAYLASASLLEDPEQWYPCVERMTRAARISLALRNRTLLDRVVASSEAVLLKHNGSDQRFLSARLMELLLELGRGDAEKYAALAATTAARAVSDSNWERARVFWDLASRWHALAGKQDESRTAAIRSAETYVAQADATALGSASAPSAFLAADHLESALVAFRKIPGVKDRAREVHRRLLLMQERAVGEMKPTTHKTDVTDLARASADRVRGKSLRDALISFATVTAPPSVVRLRENAKDAMKLYPLQTLFASKFLSEKGQVTARGGSGRPGDDGEALVLERMYRDAKLHRELDAQGIIEPAREVLVAEHYLNVREFEAVTAQSLFVPPQRQVIFARGLLAGMQGDYLVATNLLIPQVENAIRHVLHEAGKTTSGFNQDGIQDDYSLNRLFEEHHEALVEIFDEDAVFDLRGLLVERMGSNLRNLAAHGLLSHVGHYASPASYFWWLTLRLCVIGCVVGDVAED